MAEHWFDMSLQVDGAIKDGEGRIVIDDRIATIVGESSMSLWRDTPRWLDAGSTEKRAVDLGMRCVAHAHPDCRVQWVHLTADFSATPGAVVSDMSPRDEVTEHPVKLTTTYRGGVSFEVAAVALSPELAVERMHEQDVYLPTLRVSGIHLRRAIWTFEANAQQPLHVDRDLRLLLTMPADAVDVAVQFTLRARVAVDGVTGLIPLAGHRTVTVRADDGL
jgi:hypothetical protein